MTESEHLSNIRFILDFYNKRISFPLREKISESE